MFSIALEQHRTHPLIDFGQHNDLLGFLNRWDALFYERIYTEWYPQNLPLRADGSVDYNAWAFMPLQSLIAGGIANTFGIEYRVATLALTLAAGFALAYVLYRLFIGCLNWRDRGVFDTRAFVGDESRNRLALWAVAAYAFSMASPVFITGYAEALSILLIALSVWCVLRGRYVLLLPVALLAALSRPVGVPLGAFVGLWWLWCTGNDYRRRRIEDASHSALSDAWAAFRGRFGQLLSALLVCSFAFVHPLHAALYTGRIDAYFATELGWSKRKPSEGHQYIIQWINQHYHYFGGMIPKIVVAILFVVAMVGFYYWISHKFSRTLIHPALWLWTACYMGYLFVFWLPISSTNRILLPLFPLALLVAAYLPKSRWYRPSLVAFGILISIPWVLLLWGDPAMMGNIVLVP
jgi:integral membrane protein (fragment)